MFFLRYGVARDPPDPVYITVSLHAMRNPGVRVMTSENDLNEARSEAQLILDLRDEDVAKIFFQHTMRRNLTRTVRHLDHLVKSGGDDRHLGESALTRLGFGANL
jgi:CBS-domain-containing membrane protein